MAIPAEPSLQWPPEWTAATVRTTTAIPAASNATPATDALARGPGPDAASNAVTRQPRRFVRCSSEGLHGHGVLSADGARDACMPRAPHSPGIPRTDAGGH